MNFNPLFIGQISTAGTSLGVAKLSKPNYLFSDIIKVILEDEPELNSLPKIEVLEITEPETTINPANTDPVPEINLLPVKKLSSDFAELNTKELTASTEINLPEEPTTEFEFNETELHSLFISLTGNSQILTSDKDYQQTDQITKLIESARSLKSNETLLVSVEGLEEPLQVEIKRTQNPIKDFWVKFNIPQSSDTETTTTEKNIKNINPSNLPVTEKDMVSEFAGVQNKPVKELNDLRLTADFISPNDGAAEKITDQKVVNEKIIPVKSETTTSLKGKDFQSIPGTPGINNVEENTSVFTKGSNININTNPVSGKNIKTKIDSEISFKKDFPQHSPNENITKLTEQKSAGLKESFESIKNTKPEIEKSDTVYKNLEFPRKQSENKITMDLNPGVKSDKNITEDKPVKDSVFYKKSELQTKESINKNFVEGASTDDKQLSPFKTNDQDLKTFTDKIKPEFIERNNSTETQKVVRLQVTNNENINVRDLLSSVQKTDVKMNRDFQNPDIKNRNAETSDLHSKLEKDLLRVNSKVDFDKNINPKKDLQFPGTINTEKEDSFKKLSGLDKPVLNQKVVDKSFTSLHTQSDEINKTTYSVSAESDSKNNPEISKNVNKNSLKNNSAAKTFIETEKLVSDKSFLNEPDTVNNEKAAAKEDVKNSAYPDPKKNTSSSEDFKPALKEQNTLTGNSKTLNNGNHKNVHPLESQPVETESVQLKENISLNQDPGRDILLKTGNNQIQSKTQNNLNLNPEEELPAQYLKSEKKINSEVELKNEKSNSDSTVSENIKIKNTLTENSFTSADGNKNNSEPEHKNNPVFNSVTESEQKVNSKDQSLKEIVSSETKVDQASKPDMKEINFVSKEKITTDTKHLNETFKTIRSSEIVKEIENFTRQGETKTITFKVVPESLGKIKVSLDVTELTAKATIEVETEAVKQIVQSNIETLKQSLTQNGITVSTISVSLNGSYQKQNRNVDTKRKVNEGTEDKRIDTEQESFTSRKMGYNTYEYLV